MSNSEKPINNQKWIFDICRIAILIGGFYFFSKLTRDSHVILALTSSIACFLGFFFYRKIPNKTGRSAALPAISITSGMIELVVAILLIAKVDLKTGLYLFVIPTNMMLGTLGFLSLFNAVVFYKRPDILLANYPPSPPDPIVELPNDIQKIINEGREKISKTTLATMFIFINMALIAPFLFLPNPKTILLAMGVICVIGFVTVPIMRYWATRKWQERALESGISTNLLQDAAKLGGVPWPKIKEE